MANDQLLKLKAMSLVKRGQFFKTVFFAVITIIIMTGINHASQTHTDGNLRKSSCSSLNISNDPTDVRFFLYRNRWNPDKVEELLLYDQESLSSSTFDPKQKTVLLVHGYFNNGTSDMPMTIKNSYLDAGLPYNIIVMDWGKLSTPHPRGCYTSFYLTVVKKSVPIAAQRLAEFIQFLVDSKFTTLENLHLIGFSLGAHLSGWAAAAIAIFPRNEGRKVGRLSGLDPAGPAFQRVRLQRRLKAQDATFVDIYHTAVTGAGISNRNVGHADFFPNGGRFQPGCPITSDGCQHQFAYYLFAASIHRDVYQLSACLCSPKFNYFGNICPGNCSITVLAGEPCPTFARGQFFLNTEGIPHVIEDSGSGSPMDDYTFDSDSNS